MIIHIYESSVAAVQATDRHWDGVINWVPSEQALAICIEKTPVAVSAELSGSAFEVRPDIDWSQVERKGSRDGNGNRSYSREVAAALIVAGLKTPEPHRGIELKPGDLLTSRVHDEGSVQPMITLLRQVSDDKADGWFGIDNYDRVYRVAV